MDGSAATRMIHEAHPDVRIVILSSYVDRVDVLGALEAGAVGYLLKDAHPDELLAGIRVGASARARRWRRRRRGRSWTRGATCASRAS